MEAIKASPHPSSPATVEQKTSTFLSSLRDFLVKTLSLSEILPEFPPLKKSPDKQNAKR